MLEIRIIDKISKDIIGVCRLNLKEFKDQSLVEKTLPLKAMSGPEVMGEIRIRIRVYWSKLNYFQEKIIDCEEKIDQAGKEAIEVKQYLKLIDEPFGLIIYGQINNLKDEDILETPKEKEGIIDKARLSVHPTQSNVHKSLQMNFANRIDQAFRGTLSKFI